MSNLLNLLLTAVCLTRVDPPFTSCHAGFAVQGYLAHEKHHPSLGPPYGPRHSPTVGS